MEIYKQQLGTAQNRLSAAARHMLISREKSLAGPAAALRALDPHLPLARGYTLTQLPDGKLLRSISEVTPGMRLNITVRDGQVDAEVKKTVTDKEK